MGITIEKSINLFTVLSEIFESASDGFINITVTVIPSISIRFLKGIDKLYLKFTPGIIFCLSSIVIDEISTLLES